jgi:lipoyl(octanoyl) transferase
MDEQTAVQTAEQSMQAIANCLSYEQVTQKLIDNIAKRHAGHIQLRALAPK